MTASTPITDALFLAAHPDDIEIQCGGTILQMVAAGRRVVLADMTRGERGTRGTPELRATEAAAATRLLGVQERINLGLPDSEIRDDSTCLAAVVGLIRKIRPTLLVAPLPHDLHPDHAGTGLVAKRAMFHAGLAKVLPELGAPFRPSYFLCYPSHEAVSASLCVDITPYAERKLEAIACYRSQIDPSQRAHLVRGVDLLERARVTDRFYGAQIGVACAEPFVHNGPLRISELGRLIGS